MVPDVLQAQRRGLVDLRDAGDISDDLLLKLLRELDLEGRLSKSESPRRG